jgi:hypothetical protein
LDCQPKLSVKRIDEHACWLSKSISAKRRCNSTIILRTYWNCKERFIENWDFTFNVFPLDGVWLESLDVDGRLRSLADRLKRGSKVK